MNDDELKHLWKSQAVDTAALPEQLLRQHAGALQRRVARRNLLEMLAAVVVVCGFGAYLWMFRTPLMQAGSVLAILGTALVMWQMRRRASSRALPDNGLPCRDFHRAELARQRDALRTVWLWYVAPFIPGVVVFRWGVETELGADAPFARGLAANLAIAAVFAIVIAINLMAARKLQRQIDRIDGAAAD